jgi:hypothetical protein
MANYDSQTTLEKRLAKYGAMSLAAAAGVLATPAHASLLITDASGACPFTSTTVGALYFNGATQSCSATATGAMFQIEKIVGLSGSIALKVEGVSSHAQVAGNGFIPKLLSGAFAGFTSGSFLGTALEVRSSSGAHSGAWSSGDTGYVGLLSSPSGFHYGWAQVSITGYDATLIRFAYDTTAGGAPSVTPEPSSMALLALGAAGVLAYRRKRAKAV